MGIKTYNPYTPSIRNMTGSDFSGVVFVISEKSEPVMFLLEGVYGLYVLIPIVFLLSMFIIALYCAYCV